MHLKTAYFTLGQSHVHRYDRTVLDHNIVIEMTSSDPRASMFELFGKAWSFEYPTPPDMKFYPRGIFRITHKPTPKNDNTPDIS